MLQNTYHNPLLPGFYPDPSICRVGDQCGQLKPRTLIFQYFWAYILHFFTKTS